MILQNSFLNADVLLKKEKKNLTISSVCWTDAQRKKNPLPESFHDKLVVFNWLWHLKCAIQYLKHLKSSNAWK